MTDRRPRYRHDEVDHYIAEALRPLLDRMPSGSPAKDMARAIAVGRAVTDILRRSVRTARLTPEDVAAAVGVGLLSGFRATKEDEDYK